MLHLKNRAMATTHSPKASARSPGLLEAKFWVDEIYQAFIVEPLRMLGEFFFGIRSMDRGHARQHRRLDSAARRILLKLTVQRGYLQGYAAAMLLGIAVILLFDLHAV